MKSGTSSLWALLRDHPGIWMPMPKELPFFNGPDYAAGWDEFARRNLRGAPAGATIGKATPAYMAGAPMEGVAREDPEREIPERIARQFPGVKLIAILRDPVKRALSHYSMARNVGPETRDVDTAFSELLEPTALAASRRDPHRLQGYVVLGEYGRILRGYLDVFDPSQVLTLSTGELASDPRSVLASVWPFIGVPDHEPADLHTRYMVSSELTARHRLIGFNGRGPAMRAVRKTARALPAPIADPLRRVVWRRALRSVASEPAQDEASPQAPKDELSSELRERLVAHYEPDSALLEEIFGWSPLQEGGPRDDEAANPVPGPSSQRRAPGARPERAPETAAG